MTFTSRLTDKGDYLPELIDKIHRSNLPLFLYGAGKYANMLCVNCLWKKDEPNQQIKFDEIVVSTLPENKDVFFHGQMVKEFDQAVNEYPSINVLAGLSLEPVLDKLKKHPKVRNIFFYDATFRGNNDLMCHFSRNFLLENDHELTSFYNDLEDELSRKTMIAFFNQHLTGNCEYVDEVFVNNQYFTDPVKLRDDEIFVDCGAYTGDTVNAFLRATKERKYEHIFSIEPDTLNFKELLKLGSAIPRFTCINKGTWNEKTILKFSNDGNTTSTISQNGEIQVEVDTIDNMLNGQSATYIKMDIEGAELPSLIGAEKTIRNYKPKLAISVYHKYDDLLTIPQYIKSLNNGYKFYLRAHDKPYFFDLVLYAV